MGFFKVRQVDPIAPISPVTAVRSVIRIVSIVPKKPIKEAKPADQISFKEMLLLNETLVINKPTAKPFIKNRENIIDILI